jgi:hypothetical protein
MNDQSAAPASGVAAAAESGVPGRRTTVHRMHPTAVCGCDGRMVHRMHPTAVGAMDEWCIECTLRLSVGAMDYGCLWVRWTNGA